MAWNLPSPRHWGLRSRSLRRPWARSSLERRAPRLALSQWLLASLGASAPPQSWVPVSPLNRRETEAGGLAGSGAFWQRRATEPRLAAAGVWFSEAKAGVSTPGRPPNDVPRLLDLLKEGGLLGMPLRHGEGLWRHQPRGRAEGGAVLHVPHSRPVPSSRCTVDDVSFKTTPSDRETLPAVSDPRRRAAGHLLAALQSQGAGTVGVERSWS